MSTQGVEKSGPPQVAPKPNHDTRPPAKAAKPAVQPRSPVKHTFEKVIIPAPDSHYSDAQMAPSNRGPDISNGPLSPSNRINKIGKPVMPVVVSPLEIQNRKNNLVTSPALQYRQSAKFDKWTPAPQDPSPEQESAQRAQNPPQRTPDGYSKVQHNKRPLPAEPGRRSSRPISRLAADGKPFFQGTPLPTKVNQVSGVLIMSKFSAPSERAPPVPARPGDMVHRRNEVLGEDFNARGDPNVIPIEEEEELYDELYTPDFTRSSRPHQDSEIYDENFIYDGIRDPHANGEIYDDVADVDKSTL